MLPAESTATPRGLFISAAAAGPASPEYPATPVPAIVEIVNCGALWARAKDAANRRTAAVVVFVMMEEGAFTLSDRIVTDLIMIINYLLIILNCLGLAEDSW